MKRLPAALTAALLALLAGCSSPASSNGSGSTAAASSAPPAPAVAVAGKASAVSYAEPVKLTVSNGTFASVQVTVKDGGQALDGAVSADKTSWESEAAPRPANAYQVAATVTDAEGATRDLSMTFTVAAVPSDHRLSFSVTPDDGSTVGIGQPVVVRFLTPVTRKAALEKAMTVTATAPSGEAVPGSWHWLNASEVHWRPKTFWTTGTKVKLDMAIAGLQVSSDRYGRRDYSQTFTIGVSHVAKVDAVTKLIRVYHDGKLVNTWPTGTGKKGLETYSGTYVVLGKASVVQMDSCSARITCDKKDPDYYDEKEFWATRVTRSGTFLHAADWDPLIGKANVSHGCIHLTGANAKEFYDQSVIGDVVIVSGTGRGPEERIATQDPGLYDWNISWSAWQAGSALD